MAKTELTKQLEKEIHDYTARLGLLGCFEVSVGRGGKEYIDFATLDSKAIFRCYEIKVSKSDFYSKAKKSFVGHYNYFVMPKSLYEEVSKDIPKHIGVFCGSENGKVYGFVKKPIKQTPTVSLDILKTSMCFSLYREWRKALKSADLDNLAKLNSKIRRLEKDIIETKNDIIEKNNDIRIIKGYLRENGTSWNKVVDDYMDRLKINKK